MKNCCLSAAALESTESSHLPSINCSGCCFLAMCVLQAHHMSHKLLCCARLVTCCLNSVSTEYYSQEALRGHCIVSHRPDAKKYHFLIFMLRAAHEG